VNDLTLMMTPALLQPEPLQLTTDMIKFAVIVGLFVIVMIVALVYVFKAMKPRSDMRASDLLREDFDKSKDTLLLAAQARKATRETDEGAERQRESEDEEKALLLENIDPSLVIGNNCPLSGLEMMDDQEIIIDPYTGQGYHFSSFLNDWPAGRERPKFVYRYPQGTIVKTINVVTDY